MNKEYTMAKMYVAYVEILLDGENEIQAEDALDGQLFDIFGDENYTIQEFRELTEDEIIEIESGVHDEVVGVTVHDIDSIEPVSSLVEKELDDMELRRDEIASDELGA